MPDIRELKIDRQMDNIDIVVTLDGSTAICIEDKRGSREHSNQLTRYLSVLEKKGFARSDILPVYVQTWDQGSFDAVLNAGFKVMSRKDLLALLQGYLNSGGDNAIARELHDHLSGLDSKFESYLSRPARQWDHFAWMGFYSELRKRMGTGEWCYVPNPSGGFIGFWWGWEARAAGPEPYLQLEQEKLCFKIDAPDEADLRLARAEWAQGIREAAALEGLPVRKPSRWGLGKTMTVQVYDGDYRRLDADGRLDMDATLDLLQSASKVMRRFREATQPACS